MKNVFFMLSCLRFLPHIVTYCLLKDRVTQDLDAWIAAIDDTRNNRSRLKAYCWLLANLMEYRSLLYFRLGRLGSVLKLFAKPMPTCFFETFSRNVGGGLVVHHGHSMRLAADLVGKNLQVWHMVTIGKARPGGKRPVIGDNVRVFTGSVVLGNITIGNNVTIGANSVVLKSVPDNCVVVGNPAHIVKKDGVRCDERL